MPKYVIEREIPGAGELSADDLLRRHAEESCFPTDHISEVMAVIDPNRAPSAKAF